MQKLGFVHQKDPSNFLRKLNGRIGFGNFMAIGSSSRVRGTSVDLKAMTNCRIANSVLIRRRSSLMNSSKFKSMLDENVEELADVDEDDELCPVDCVREFQTDEEFLTILEKAKETNALVVVDFYRTSCGSCKYIEQGFTKICKGSGKHNVLDEYDEQSVRLLTVSGLGLFHFSISTKTECCWNRLQRETRSEYSKPFSSTQVLLLLKKPIRFLDVYSFCSCITTIGL